MDGVLVIDKPAGLTSHDVVAAARRATGQKRVGHTGTLDPSATGVLALVLGRATRLSRFLTASRKRYEAGVRLGIATDTYDAAGTAAGEAASAAAIETIGPTAVEAALGSFRGSFEQAPPPFSAKKIGGIRAYTLARQQARVAPPPVMVTVHALQLVSVDGGLVTLEIACSAGFYVRSLAHNLGLALGVGAHLERLRRTASGEFTIEEAFPLERLLEGGVAAAESRLIPLDRLLGDCPGVQLTQTGAQRIRHGRTITGDEIRQWLTPQSGEATTDARDRPLRLLGPDGRLLGVATPGADGAANRLRQGYGGPPKLYAKAEAAPYLPATQGSPGNGARVPLLHPTVVLV
ncbi:MAG: tRNA pseudouridine(55) synthase TruB [Luteitalea sp.]|nr:tRNA pseudouridine(55) synthase TruB [Luteitalea sp.]